MHRIIVATTTTTTWITIIITLSIIRITPRTAFGSNAASLRGPDCSMQFHSLKQM